jgi:hypothetical protein
MTALTRAVRKGEEWAVEMENAMGDDWVAGSAGD